MVYRFTFIILLMCFTRSVVSQAWSPDGSRIAFFYIHSIEDIYLVNADGSNFSILDDHAERDFAVDWSPDGGSILFTSLRDGHHEIYSKRLSDGSLTRQTDSTFDSQDGVYSADGKLMIFTSNRDGNSEIYIKDLVSNTIKRITSTPDFKEVAPQWVSPEKILFAGAPGDEQWDLWVMNTNGKKRKRILQTPGVGEFHLSISPDKKQVAYIVATEGAFELRVTNLDGSETRTIVRKEGFQAFYPRWSPDGKMIAFTRDVMEGTEEGYPALLKVDLQGNEELITNDNSFHLYETSK